MRVQMHRINSNAKCECLSDGHSVVGVGIAGVDAPRLERASTQQDFEPPIFTRNREKDCDKGQKGNRAEPSLIQKPYKIVRCACRCRFCADCAVGIGLSIREKLKPVVASWKGIVMLSLTVNPKQFESPEKAYRFVSDGRLISRLVRELCRRDALASGKFFSVVEFQKNGYPHWHVLLESEFIPHELIAEVWNRWGPSHCEDGPDLGFVWISQYRFKNPDHAAAYATKYLIKTPQDGWPDWVLDYRGQIHRCSRSRNLFGPPKDQQTKSYSHCPVCFCESCREAVAKKTTPCQCDSCVEARDAFEKFLANREKKQRDPNRTVRERLKECGNSTVVLRRLVEEVRPSQLKCKFLCVVEESFDSICRRLGQSKASQLFLSQEQLDEIFLVDRKRKRERTNFEWVP